MKQLTTTFLACAFLLTGCTEETPPLPSPPIDAPIDPIEVSIDPVEVTISDLAEMAAFISRTKEASDTTYIAAIVDYIKVDSMDFAGTLTEFHKLSKKKTTKNWNDKAVVPLRDSVRVEYVNYVKSGRVPMAANKAGNEFRTINKTDSVYFAQDGNNLRILNYAENIAAGVYSLADTDDLMRKIVEIAARSADGEEIIVNVSGSIPITAENVECLEQLADENIVVELTPDAIIAAAEPQVAIDGRVLAALVDAGIVKQSEDGYFFVAVDNHLDAMRGKDFPVVTDYAENTADLSWAYPLELRLDGQTIEGSELEPAAPYRGTITIPGQIGLENVSDKTMDLFSSEHVKDAGKPFYMEKDALINSLGNFTLINDEHSNKSLQKLEYSFYYKNPLFTIASNSDYFYWTKDAYGSQIEFYSLPKRNVATDMTINWPKDAKYIYKWEESPVLNNRIMVDFDAYGSIALVAGLDYSPSIYDGAEKMNSGRIVENGDKIFLLTSTYFGSIVLNGFNDDQRRVVLQNWLPPEVKIEGFFVPGYHYITGSQGACVKFVLDKKKLTH